MPNPLGVNSLALAYDQANRLISAYNPITTNETYAYNAANQRISKTINNTAEYYLYGIDGVLLGTYSLSGSTFQRKQTRYWFGSRLLRIRTEGAPAVEESILTDRLGSVVWRGGTRSKYAPYGEERNITAQGKEKFATYYRDDTTLDYAINRYYSSQQARFLSPDPHRASGGPADPGSWNRYSYVQGDPMNFRDPLGLLMCGIDPEGSTPGCGGPGDRIDKFPLYVEHPIGEPAPSTPPTFRRRRSTECDRMLDKVPTGFDAAFDGTALDIVARFSATAEQGALLAITWWAENSFRYADAVNHGPAYGPLQVTKVWSPFLRSAGFDLSRVFGSDQEKFDGQLWDNMAAGVVILADLYARHGSLAAGYYRAGEGNWRYTREGKAAFDARQEMYNAAASQLQKFLKECITQ